MSVFQADVKDALRADSDLGRTPTLAETATHTGSHRLSDWPVKNKKKLSGSRRQQRLKLITRRCGLFINQPNGPFSFQFGFDFSILTIAEEVHKSYISHQGVVSLRSK